LTLAYIETYIWYDIKDLLLTAYFQVNECQLNTYGMSFSSR